MMYEKKFVTLKNGENYAYIQKGQGENVILLHGNMTSSVSMLPIVNELAEKYTCFAPDLRGFGDSSYNNSFRHLKELAKDILQFMDELKIDKAHLIGWSTGCPVSLELAAMAKDRVISIFGIEGVSHKGYYILKKDENGKVMKNTPYSSYEEMNSDTKNYPMHSIFIKKRVDVIAKLWNSLLLIHNRPDEEFFNLLVSENAKERCQNDINWCWSVENMSDSDTIYAKGENTINDVKCPCTFTTGDDDMIVVRKEILENHSAIPHSKLIEYKNCGHAPIFDCPELLFKDIKEHLENAK